MSLALLAQDSLEFHPLFILAVGVATVIGMILVLKINAFIALITAAIVVSMMAPGDPADKIARVATAFGSTAGSIGIVIALAAVIGTCMMDSGAADRIVRSFLNVLGEKRASLALMGSGFVLAVPVFFDTVFYLLVPLARSLYKRTRKNYLMYLLAIGAGGAITHTLVPPTPGPLLMADALGVDVGRMMFIGAIVALPAAFTGVLVGKFMDGWLHVPFREIGNPTGGSTGAEDGEDVATGATAMAEGASDERLHQQPFEPPSLGLSILPVVLPVLLISSLTIVKTVYDPEKIEPAQTAVAAEADVLDEVQEPDSAVYRAAKGAYPIASIIGNANFALLAAAAVSLILLWMTRRPTLTQLSATVETSLMSGGVIILITAGGGAFGAMLKAADIGPTIQELFSGETAATGVSFLFLAYGIAALLKVAQGSSTVAMITVSGMMAAMIEGVDLGFDAVYLATAIGAGSLMGSWMNDSGFWIFAKMGGLTEAEALKSWTPMLAVCSIVSLAMSLLLAVLFPLTG